MNSVTPHNIGRGIMGIGSRPFTICAIIRTHKILFWPVLIQLYSNVRLLLAAFISPVLNLLPTSFYRNKDD